MSSSVFYRKWRPQTLSEVVGQEPVTRTLLNALRNGRTSHAYLFCGPRGTGKTSTARILAKAVNCLTGGKGEPCNTCEVCKAISTNSEIDVIEIDAASRNKAEEIRELCEKVGYAPNRARYKVYIIDEVHMLSSSAANALLKTLEEPPPHVIFILATTEVHKILPTIISRCQRYDFRRLTQTDVIMKLGQIAKDEGITVSDEALRLIARAATGSMRDALNLLEQLTIYYGNEPTLLQTQMMLGMTGDTRVKELAKQVIDSDITSGIRTINSINNDGLDLKQFNRELVEYLRALLLMKTGSGDAVDMNAEDLAELKTLAGKASLEKTLNAVKLFGQLQTGYEDYPTLPMEMALLDSALTAEADSSANRERPPARPAVPPPQQRAAVPPPPKKESAPFTATPAPAPASPTTPQPSPVAEGAKAMAPKAEIPATEPVSDIDSLPFTVEEPATEFDNAVPQNQGNAEQINYLRDNWKRVIDEAPQDVKRSPAVAILRSAGVEPISIENNTVTLSFKFDNHRQIIEKAENQQAAEKIIGSFLGITCRVSCVTENNHLLKAALKMGAQRIESEEK